MCNDVCRWSGCFRGVAIDTRSNKYLSLETNPLKQRAQKERGDVQNMFACACLPYIYTLWWWYNNQYNEKESVGYIRILVHRHIDRKDKHEGATHVHSPL